MNRQFIDILNSQEEGGRPPAHQNHRISAKSIAILTAAGMALFATGSGFGAYLCHLITCN